MGLREAGYSHAPIACDVDRPWHGVPVPVDDAYYLVSSLDCLGAAGSAGRDSSGTERPADGGCR